MILSAVLWDLDGTLVDSEPYWFRTEMEIAAEFGGVWTHEDAVSCVGSPVEVTAAAIAARGADLSVEALVGEMFGRMDQLIRAEGLIYRPGALELLAETAAEGVPQALCTMSYGAYADAVLAALPPHFSAIRLGDSVEHGKPAPDIYLAAAADLGLPITQCLGIEDSEPGARAVLASGATPISVPGDGGVPELPGLIYWETLAGARLADLRRVHANYQSTPAGARLN